MAKYTVKDLMVQNPIIITPDSSLRDATEIMEKIDCGVMPVGSSDKLVGMITDRDIAVHAIAMGKDPERTKVKEVMTGKVLFIAEDADLAEAADLIKERNVNRLIVRDRKGRISGILSLSGLIRQTRDTRAIAQFMHQLASATNGRKKKAA